MLGRRALASKPTCPYERNWLLSFQQRFKRCQKSCATLVFVPAIFIVAACAYLTALLVLLLVVPRYAPASLP